MLLAPNPPGVVTACVQHGFQHGIVAEGRLVHPDRFLRNLEHTNAFNPTRRTGKVLVDRLGVDADGFEKLGTAVAHIGRNAHLGHDLGKAFSDRLHIVGHRLLGPDGARQTRVHMRHRLERKIGVDRLGPVACERSEMVNLACAAGFHNDAGAGAQPLAHQMLVDGTKRQQSGDRHLAFAQSRVADNQDVLTASDGVHRLGAQRGELGFDTLVAPSNWIGDVQCVAAKLSLGMAVDFAQLRHVGDAKHRLRHFETHRRVDLVDVKQVGLWADK